VGTDTGSIDLPPGEGEFASLITFTGAQGKWVARLARLDYAENSMRPKLPPLVTTAVLYALH